MASLFNSNQVIGLIDKHTGKIKVEDKINIILTPSYYWVKRAYLEVNFTSSALKYAPSVFEGMLPEGDYDYYAVKTTTEYIFFAYEPDLIISSLHDKGIQSTQIAGIYFAQNEMLNITNPIQCNEEDAIVVHNDTVLQVPKYLVNESTLKRNIEEIKELSKHKIILQSTSTSNSVKKLAPLLSILAVLVLLYATQLFFTYAQQEKLQANASVFEAYGLPSTFVQNSSIEKKLSKSFQEQKSFRKLIFAILKLPLSQQETIKDLRYEKKLFTILFEMQDYTKLKTIADTLKKSLDRSVKINIDKNTMRVEIK